MPNAVRWGPCGADGPRRPRAARSCRHRPVVQASDPCVRPDAGVPSVEHVRGGSKHGVSPWRSPGVGPSPTQRPGEPVRYTDLERISEDVSGTGTPTLFGVDATAALTMPRRRPQRLVTGRRRLAAVTTGHRLADTDFDGLVAAALAGEQAAWEELVDRLQRVAWKAIGGFDL